MKRKVQSINWISPDIQVKRCSSKLNFLSHTTKAYYILLIHHAYLLESNEHFWHYKAHSTNAYAIYFIEFHSASPFVLLMKGTLMWLLIGARLLIIISIISVYKDI